MATRKEIRQELLDLASQSESDDFATMIDAHLNHVYFHILEKARIATEQRYFTLTTVANQRTYGLPGEVKWIENVEEPSNDDQIWTVAPEKFERIYTGNSDTGTPHLAFPYGTYGVKKQPATSDVLTLSSSHASDTGSNFQVVVIGRVSGVLTREVVTLAGTSEVNTTTTWDTDIERIVKVPQTAGSVFNGNVTIQDQNPPGDTLAVLPPWWNSIDFVWIAFHPIPDAALTYNVRAQARKAPLVYDEDWPDFDADYHDLLTLGVGARLLPTIGKSTLAKSMGDTFKDRLNDFLSSADRTFNRVRQMADVSNATSGGLRLPGDITVTVS